MIKPDDVLSYTFNGRECEMVVHHVANGVIFSAASRCVGEWEWYIYEQEGGAQLSTDGDIEDLRLHPNPDEVWASYCAALLRN